MLGVDIQRQNVPCVQRLAIWCPDVERRDLTSSKSKLFRVVDVVKEKRVEFVSVQSTYTY